MSVDIERLERLEKTAMPGPWSTTRMYSLFRYGRKHCGDWAEDENREIYGADYVEGNNPYDEHDADYIAALRNAAPALIAAYRELRDDSHCFREAVGEVASALGATEPWPPEDARQITRRLIEHAEAVERERDELQEQLAEARKDTERLEWLERQPDFAGKPWKITHRIDGVWTIREAIDAARKAEAGA